MIFKAEVKLTKLKMLTGKRNTHSLIWA